MARFPAAMAELDAASHPRSVNDSTRAAERAIEAALGRIVPYIVIRHPLYLPFIFFSRWVYHICRALRGKVEVIGILPHPDEQTKRYVAEMFGTDRVIACRSHELPKNWAIPSQRSEAFKLFIKYKKRFS